MRAERVLSNRPVLTSQSLTSPVTRSERRDWPGRSFGYRLLARGLGSIVYCPESLVYHNSIKSFEEQLRTEIGYGISIGAAAVKYARCGDGFAIRMFLTWLWHMAVRRLAAGVFKWHSWAVVRLALLQFRYPWVGIARSRHWPLNTLTWVYLPLTGSTGL